MNHRSNTMIALLLVACTAKEHSAFAPDLVSSAGDAGVDAESATSASVAPTDAGAGGEQQLGRGAAAEPGAISPPASDPGAAAPQVKDAGAPLQADMPGCTGCARISAPGNRTTDYQLAFDGEQNLSGTMISWRVRVRDYSDEVSLVPYAQSGDGFGEEATPGIVSVTEADGWQDVALDLSRLEAFRSAGVIDSGANAGEFDEGFPFDKSRVIRVGLALQPAAESGLASRALIEIDSLTFSDNPSFDVPFATDPGGLALVDSPGASVIQVSE